MPMDLNLIVEHLTQEKNVLLVEAEKMEHSSKMLRREAKLMQDEARRLRSEAQDINAEADSMRTRAVKIDEEIEKLRDYCEWMSPDDTVCEETFGPRKDSDATDATDAKVDRSAPKRAKRKSVKRKRKPVGKRSARKKREQD